MAKTKATRRGAREMHPLEKAEYIGRGVEEAAGLVMTVLRMKDGPARRRLKALAERRVQHLVGMCR